MAIEAQRNLVKKESKNMTSMSFKNNVRSTSQKMLGGKVKKDYSTRTKIKHYSWKHWQLAIQLLM